MDIDILGEKAYFVEWIKYACSLNVQLKIHFLNL